MKRLVTDYSFSPAQNQITFGGGAFDIRRLLYVANLTTGTDIYLPADAALGYDAVSDQTVTFAADLSAMASNDALLIYEDVESDIQQRIAATAFSRPADTTAYASRDLVAPSSGFPGFVFPDAVRAAGQTLAITRAVVRKSSNPLASATFRLFIFSAQPTVAVADNGAFEDISATNGRLAIDDVDKLIGWIDVIMDRSGTAGAVGDGVPAKSSVLLATPASGTTLYGLLVTTGAYTPTSGETFNATLEGFWS